MLDILLIIVTVLFIAFCIFAVFAYKQINKAKAEMVKREYQVFFRRDHLYHHVIVEAFDFQDAAEESCVDMHDITSVHIHIPKAEKLQGYPE